MLPAFVIGLREGLETIVVLGAIVVFLRAQGRRDLLPRIWRASALATVICLVFALLVRFVEINLGWRQQEQLETVVGFAAVCMVTYMVVWMRRFPKDLERDSTSAAARALATDSGNALVAMAFFAVLREGFEIVLFVMATIGLSGDNSVLATLGAVLGIAVAIGVGVGIVRGSKHIEVARFFRVTAIVLVLSAAGIAMTTVHTANAAGWITFGQTPQFDLHWLAPPGSVLSSITTGMFGLEPYPVIIEVIAWLAYFVPMMLVVLWPRQLIRSNVAISASHEPAAKASSRRRTRVLIIAAVVAVLAGSGTAVALLEGQSSPTPTSATGGVRLLYAALQGVACPSTTSCVAVGQYLPTDKDAAIGDPDGDGRATHTLVEERVGSTWHRIPSPDEGRGGATLTAVDCPSGDDCIAVGSYRRSLYGAATTSAPPTYPLVESYNGHAWKLLQSPSVAPNSTLSDVACVSADRCVAVGTTSVGLSSSNPTSSFFIEDYNGTSWSLASVTKPPDTSTGLTAVSCPSATSCVAVGYVAPKSNSAATRPLIVSLDNNTWNDIPLPAGSNGSGILYGVSCPAAGSCVAVGNSVVLRKSGSGLILRMTASSWSTDAAALEESGDATFNTVGCSSISDCIVTGNSSLALADAPIKVAAELDGATWHPLKPAADGGNVEAITCPSANGCIGVGSLAVNNFGNTTAFAASVSADRWESDHVVLP